MYDNRQPRSRLMEYANLPCNLLSAHSRTLLLSTPTPPRSAATLTSIPGRHHSKITTRRRDASIWRRLAGTVLWQGIECAQEVWEGTVHLYDMSLEKSTFSGSLHQTWLARTETGFIWVLISIFLMVRLVKRPSNYQSTPMVDTTV